MRLQTGLQWVLLMTEKLRWKISGKALTFLTHARYKFITRDQKLKK